MKVTQTYLQGCFVIESAIFTDERGDFFESFNKKKFKEKTGIEIDFVQDNQSISQRGVLRGLHFQKGEFAQAKLVRVVKGRVLDVVVDIRKESKTFGSTFSCVLSAKNKKQVFISKGFAHGFIVLEDDTIFVYKCDEYYHKASEEGIKYNDKNLQIDWMLSENEIILSAKDKELPNLKELAL